MTARGQRRRWQRRATPGRLTGLLGRRKLPLVIPILLFPCVNCIEHAVRFLMSWEARQRDAHRVTLKKLANSVEVGANALVTGHQSFAFACLSFLRWS